MGFSGGVRFFRIVSGEGLLGLLVTRHVEVEVQVWVDISSFPLKGKPPRSPLSTGLIPQSSYNFVPLSNQSYLLMKIPTQPTTLLSQAFCRIYSLGSLLVTISLNGSGSKHLCKFITLSPKGYYLIPSNNTKNLLVVFLSYCIH